MQNQLKNSGCSGVVGEQKQSLGMAYRKNNNGSGLGMDSRGKRKE